MEPNATPSTSDDRPTLAALGILAFALADISHEALGHGSAILAQGYKITLLCTCFINHTGATPTIAAAGGLMNLAVGTAALAALRWLSLPTPRLRYFILLIAAFNLFFAFGYPAYSGIAQFGDWSEVIAGLHPQGLWRAALIIIAVAGYYATMRLLAPAIAPFAASPATSRDSRRFHRITLIPYIAAMVLACMAGALNPHGWRTMFTSGLPAAAAAFGLTQLDHLLPARPTQSTHPPIAPMQRSIAWITAAAIVLILFVGVLGPGIPFS